jgi:carbamoyl-phosphate synthase large subunit
LESTEIEFPIHGGNILISVGGADLKKKIIPLAKKMRDLGFIIFATEDTKRVLKENAIEAVKLYKVHESGKEPNIMQCLQEGNIDMVINIPLPSRNEGKFQKVLNDDYKIRRMAVDFNIPVITTLELAKTLIDSIERVRNKPLTTKSLNEYLESLKMVYW